MKLLFAHQNLGEFGGAETNILLTAKELRRRGHVPALLYCQRTGRNETQWRETFSRTFSLPAPGNVEAAEAMLAEFEPDLIYLHNLQDVPVLEKLLDSSIPTVKMVHDHALYCMRSYKYNYFTRKPCLRALSPFCVFPCLASVARNHAPGHPFKWVSFTEKQQELRLTRRCHHLVVYSNYLKEELVRNGFDRDRIQVCVPIRVDVNESLDSTFNERNLVLFVGQIIRGKGVDALLRALAQIHVRFEAIIVGDGNHRQYCERLCRKLKLQDRVRFQGYVPPDQLSDFYLEASVFVMSSLWPEPFGMAGPEAMRYGLPVVAFDAGGIREWLKDGENGFLVPWNDTAKFVTRIETLLRNKDMARRLGQCAKAGIKQYEAARQIDALEALFHRVVRQAQPPSRVIPRETLVAYD